MTQTIEYGNPYEKITVIEHKGTKVKIDSVYFEGIIYDLTDISLDLINKEILKKSIIQLEPNLYELRLEKLWENFKEQFKKDGFTVSLERIEENGAPEGCIAFALRAYLEDIYEKPEKTYVIRLRKRY